MRRTIAGAPGALLPLALAAAVGRTDAQLPADTAPAARRDSAGRAGRRDTVTTLEAVRVTAARRQAAPVPAMRALTLPVTASVTAQQAAVTTNVVDPQDVVKYLPSVFVRKRNYGDQGSTLATRVWGPQSGARSLIFADGVLLSALFANNNTIGGPRWNMIAPSEVARVDLMYGPYSAAYAGNSIGAVMEITTRLPDRLEGAISQTQAYQRFDLYGTRSTYPTGETQAAIGDRFGKLAVFAAGNLLNTRGQPLLFVTRAGSTLPADAAGGIVDTDRQGAAVNYFGASAIPLTRLTTGKLKVAYDVTPALRVSYTAGVFGNRTDAGVDSYLTSTAGAGAGAETYAGQAGFAGGTYAQRETHSVHTLSLRTTAEDPGAATRTWDGEAVATRYRFDNSRQRSPGAAPAAGTTFGSAGRVAVYDGTGWSTLDVKGAYHPGGAGRAAHTLSAGVHYDRYALVNPTYNTADWRDADAPFGALVSEGGGRTETSALWAQDAVRLAPALKLTVGGRLERWRAFDGFNANTNASGLTRFPQQGRTSTRVSPKGVLAWTPSADWAVTGSVGKAYRFATATELYQLVTTGATFYSPSPNLRPDNVIATELRGERRFAVRGRPGFAQLALFGQDVRDPILPLQYVNVQPASGQTALAALTRNADYARARGAELAFGASPAAALELSGSATFLDARVYAADARGTPTAPLGSTRGKFLPNVPKWRATFTATVRPLASGAAADGGPLALTLAGRYSTKVYSTLDNSELLFNRYLAFAEWFVADARATYRLGRGVTVAAGVDNLLDRKYFLFHPFPQCTLVASAGYAF